MEPIDLLLVGACLVNPGDNPIYQTECIVIKELPGTGS